MLRPDGNAQIPRFEEIRGFRDDTLRALKHCMDNICGQTPLEVVSMSDEALTDRQQARLEELDRASSMQLLAAIEATLRMDAAFRWQTKQKDALSRDLRARQKANNRLRFDEDILECWSSHHPGLKAVVGELRGAFKYRHWLAHGMYWTPKLGRRYDFDGIEVIAFNIAMGFPLRVS